MPSGLGMTLIQRFTVKTTTTIISARRSGDNTNVPLLVCNQPVTYTINLSSSITIPDGYINLIDSSTNSIIGGAAFTGGLTSINVEITLLNGFDATYNSYAIKAKYDGYVRIPPLQSLGPSESAIFYQDVLPDGDAQGYLQVDSITTTATAVESFLNDFNITATLGHGSVGFPTVMAIWDIFSSTQNVTGATNASPIQITTAGPHDLVTGSRVQIAGVLGNTAANGTWTIIVTGATTFTLTGSIGNGTYTSGGVITKEAIVTTYTTHHLLSGQTTRISGSGVSAYNNFFTVGALVTSNTFSLYNTFNTTHAGSNVIVVSNITLNATSITVTTASPHHLNDRDAVYLNNIYGHDPYFYFGDYLSEYDSSFAGTYQISNVTTTTFDVNPPYVYSVFSPGFGESMLPSFSGPVPNPVINSGIIDFYGIENDGYDTSFYIGSAAVSNNSATVVADGFDGYAMVWPEASGTYGIEAIYTPTVDCYGNFNSGSTFDSALTSVTINGLISDMSLSASPYNISNATNASPIRIQTTVQHALNTGDFVEISGVTGNTAANGVFKITALSYQISGATNASPIQITTSATHALITGQLVTVAGVLGNTAANGVWTITSTGSTTFTLNGSVGNDLYIPSSGDFVFSSNTFTLDGSSGNGTYSGGGLVTPLNARDISDAYTVTPIQITTSLAHGLTTGNTVTISGTSAPNTNGTWTVTVINTTKFSLNTSTGEGTPAHYNDGIVNISNNTLLRADFPNGPPGTPGTITFNKVTPNTGSLGIATVNNRYAYLTVSASQWAHSLPYTFNVQGVYSPTNENVTAATFATPIQITTGTPHNLATGHIVTIAGVTGNTAANGTWTVTVNGASTFTLDGSVGNAAYISGGTAKAAVAAVPEYFDVLAS